MVAAVFYFATTQDHGELLDYLGEPGNATLHPWPIVRTPLDVLSRTEAVSAQQVMISRREFGPPVSMSAVDVAQPGPARHTVFNRLNWKRLRPNPDEGLANSNTSPVLFWEPGAGSPVCLAVSKIGSQADSMAAISAEYARWANRTMAWVRRKGTKVWGNSTQNWGLENARIRPDLDVQLDFVNSVYALPGALAALEQGSVGRSFLAEPAESQDNR